MFKRVTLTTEPHDVQPILSSVSSVVMGFDLSSEDAARRTDFRFGESSSCDSASDVDVCFKSFRISAVPLLQFCPRALWVARPSPLRVICATQTTPPTQPIVALSVHSEVGRPLVPVTARAPLETSNSVSILGAFPWHVSRETFLGSSAEAPISESLDLLGERGALPLAGEYRREVAGVDAVLFGPLGGGHPRQGERGAEA